VKRERERVAIITSRGYEFARFQRRGSPPPGVLFASKSRGNFHGEIRYPPLNCPPFLSLSLSLSLPLILFLRLLKEFLRPIRPIEMSDRPAMGFGEMRGEIT